MKNTCASQESTVRTRHGTMDWYQIGKRVCQSCIFPPFLLNLYAEFSSVLFCFIVYTKALTMLWGYSKLWKLVLINFSSVAQLCMTLCNPHGLQHTRLLWQSPIPRANSKSCLSSQWCHPTISSSVIPYSPCLQSFSASGPFPMNQLVKSMVR